MSCNTKTSLAAVIDAVNAQLNNNYVDRDDPRIDQGVFTEPTIRGGLMLDEAAKLDFCGYVTECGQREPFGKQWVDRPLYPHNTLVSYEDEGEIKSRWQDIDDVVAGTEIGESYTAYEETRNLGLQGYTIIDSFELGATITQPNQALRHAADGKLYRWAGELPKVVSTDSTPISSGGIGDNAWLEVSDVTLRQELANPYMGAAMVGFTQSGPDASLRTAQEKMREIVSVLDFGAVGDDSTDNTEAFRAAVGSLEGVGGEVVVPTAGVYLVRVAAGEGDAFVLPEGVSIRMVEGAWLAPIDPTLGGTFIRVKGNQRIQVNIDGRCMPDDGTITGEWKSSSNSNGIVAPSTEPDQVHNVEITGCVIHSINYPIRPVGAVNWKIHQNTFYNYKLSGILFGYYEGKSCHGNLIHGNLFRNCGDTAVAFWPQAGYPAGGGCYDNIVSSNVAEEFCQRTAGYAYDFERSIRGQNYNNSIINNVASSTATSGHQVSGIVIHLTKNTIVSGNIISRVHRPSGSVDTGINATASIGALISDNIITEVSGIGINCNGAEGASVSGNKLTNCGGTTGLVPAIRVGLSTEYFSKSENCVITNNHIKYTPEYLRGGPATAAISFGSQTVNIKVSGNTIVNPPDKAISIRKSSDDMHRNLQVVGNSIFGTGAEGFFTSFPIEAEGVNSGLVESNYIFDSMMGLSVRNSNDLVVRNNVFKGDRSIGTLFFINEATDSLFEGNRCSQIVTSAADVSSRITDKAYGNRFKDNDKVITENGGLTDVPSSGTVIQHGLAGTPSSVTLTPTTSGVVGLRVSSASFSGIGITYEEPSEPVEFYWEAKL